MNAFVNYIVESGISLGLLFLVYYIFLRNETFFKANRLFLLFAVVFSSLLPLLHFKVLQFNDSSLIVGAGGESSNMLESVTVFSSSFSGSLTDFITTNNLIIIGYWTVGILLFILLVLRLSQIIKIIRANEIVHKMGIKFVYTNKNSSPYSFLRYLFVSRDFEKKAGWEKMLAHEIEHIRQKHTVDILILELVGIFQWFNPFFWMIRRVIKENHEYMADEAVLKNDVPVDAYKNILVSQWVGNQLSIANNFNSSLIKSRLKMMTKIKSSKLAGLRFISGAIMVIALLLVFACENKDSSLADEENSFLNNRGVYISNLDDNPLIIIDGELASRDAMNKLDPYDIKSVTVIKDKINPYVTRFGEQAQNGVIDILLKSGATEAQKNSVGEVAVIGFGRKDQFVNDPVFNIVDEMPEFPGGELALRKFIARTIKYPVIAQQNGIQGKVYVNFVVEKDGSVGRVKIARGVDPSLDFEALRVTYGLPKWSPGKLGGDPVAVQYTIPVNFVLQ